MAGAIVLQDGPIGKDWEEALYREGCALLNGPDASKPWVRSLRHQVHLYHLLN